MTCWVEKTMSIRFLPSVPDRDFFRRPRYFSASSSGMFPKGLIQVGDDLLIAVDIAAVNTADGTFLRPPPAAQLTDFFLIHREPLF